MKKLLEKEKDDESNEKLTKLAKSLIMNIRATMLSSSNNSTILTSSMNKQQQQQKPSDTQSSDLHVALHNYLNYIVSLSYIALKRSQLFMNENLTEVDYISLILINFVNFYF